MRTTLTLDPDVAALVEAYKKSSRKSLKGAVNELLRAGLSATGRAKKKGHQPFTQVFDVESVNVPDVRKTGEILAWLDTVEWLEKHGPRAGS